MASEPTREAPSAQDIEDLNDACRSFIFTIHEQRALRLLLDAYERLTAQPSNVVPLDPVAPDGFTRSERREVMAAIAANKARAQPAAAEDAATGSPLHVALWDAINSYATACGGDTGPRVNLTRMSAVVAVERALGALVDLRAAHAQGAGVLDRGLVWNRTEFDDGRAGYIAHVGPYECFLMGDGWDESGDELDEPEIHEWVVQWGVATEERPITEIRGAAIDNLHGRKCVADAIRKHLSDAGLDAVPMLKGAVDEAERLRGELAEMTEQYMHGIRLHANVSSMLITAETERDRLRTAATSIVEAWERSDGGGSGVEHIAAAIDAARKLVKP